MSKRMLILVAFIFTQASCDLPEGGPFYEPAPLTAEALEATERANREVLQLEDLKIGDGPLAVWGRKVSADIDVRYWDGRPIYKGPAFFYWGMMGSIPLHNNIEESGLLSLDQTGIMLSINGMAVGGTRQITIPPKLSCRGNGTDVPNPNVDCLLVTRHRKDGGAIGVRKERLTVEATLTASCVPVHSRVFGEVSCRSHDSPRRDPEDPIWRFYYAEPSRP